MNRIWISAEARALVLEVSFYKELPMDVLPNGSAYVELSDEMVKRLEEMSLIGEDWSACIIRLCRFYLGKKLN